MYGKAAGGVWMKTKLKYLLGVEFIFTNKNRSLHSMGVPSWDIESNRMVNIRGRLFLNSNTAKHLGMSGQISKGGQNK